MLDHGGFLDKFIGDAIMVIFGAPVAHADHATRAVACALEMQLSMQAVNEHFARTGLPQIEMGIGINTGEVVVGNIGSEQRLEYSALGDNVNLASRVEQLTKRFGADILLTEETRAAVPSFACLEIEKVRVKGRRGVTTLYALLATEETEPVSKLAAAHERMLEAYRGGKADLMATILKEAESLYRPDYAGLLSYYRKQVDWLRGLDAPWDGIHSLDQK